MDSSDFNEPSTGGDSTGMIKVIIIIFVVFGIIAYAVSWSIRLSDWLLKTLGF
jgi:hypothetical protein